MSRIYENYQIACDTRRELEIFLNPFVMDGRWLTSPEISQALIWRGVYKPLTWVQKLKTTRIRKRTGYGVTYPDGNDDRHEAIVQYSYDDVLKYLKVFSGYNYPGREEILASLNWRDSFRRIIPSPQSLVIPCSRRIRRENYSSFLRRVKTKDQPLGELDRVYGLDSELLSRSPMLYEAGLELIQSDPLDQSFNLTGSVLWIDCQSELYYKSVFEHPRLTYRGTRYRTWYPEIDGQITVLDRQSTYQSHLYKWLSAIATLRAAHSQPFHVIIDPILADRIGENDFWIALTDLFTGLNHQAYLTAERFPIEMGRRRDIADDLCIHSHDVPLPGPPQDLICLWKASHSNPRLELVSQSTQLDSIAIADNDEQE